MQEKTQITAAEQSAWLAGLDGGRAQKTTPVEAAVGAPVTLWIERWHGSGGKEGLEGWSILDAGSRSLVAYLGREVDSKAVTAIVMVHNAQLARASVPAAQAVGRDLQSVVSAAAGKLDAAKRCHPNAVETLIDEALEILDGDREPPAQADARDASKVKPEAGRYVLAWMEGRKVPIRAMWVPQYHLSVGDEAPEGWGEYSDEKDDWYCPEGWYEANEHEETHWAVGAPVVSWMELPRLSIAAQAAQQGGAA